MVKKGQKESYIKDEKALMNYLLQENYTNLNFKTSKLSEDVVKSFILKIEKFQKLLKGVSQKYDQNVLIWLLAHKTDIKEAFKTEDGIKKVFDLMSKDLKTNSVSGISDLKFKAVANEEHSDFKVEVELIRFGERVIFTITSDLASSTLYEELIADWNDLESTHKLPIEVSIEGVEYSFTSYKDFLDKFLETSKKGLYVQRYKGLGEMNPEQLWETTLNPQNRVLLQVSITDAIAADETFSILMGEQVEPRRKFIEDNALLAKELDV